MPYFVKEIYFTLQGEGHNAGRAAVFCRFTGCNLWSGKANDRAGPGTCAAWCDTDFLGTDGPRGGRYASAPELAEAIANAWPVESRERRFVVFTGGEPLLQLDAPLVDAVHAQGFEVAVETNGTKLPPPGIDWLCVSPKAGAALAIRKGDELKLIYPQAEAEPEMFEGLDFSHFYLQPMDGPNLRENTAKASQYCLAHPRWRLGLQLHKLVGLR